MNEENNVTNMEHSELFHYSKHSFINNMAKIEKILPNIYLTKDFTNWNEQIKSFTHIIIIDKHLHDATGDLNANEYKYFSTSPLTSAELDYGENLTVLNLNFGEKPYLTTVLPNCYRAVCFMDKALQSNGNILVIDFNGSEQKCITIVVAYLMYKHNLTFSIAFERFKNFYKTAVLDGFYMNQLYEYEPILQVQRERSRGYSCFRQMHAAILKRKKVEIDDLSFKQQQHTLTHFQLQQNAPNDLYQ